MSEAIYLAPGPDRYGFEHLKNLELGAISTFNVPARQKNPTQGPYLALCCSTDQSGRLFQMSLIWRRWEKADERRGGGIKKNTQGREERPSLLLFFNSVNSPR